MSDLFKYMNLREIAAAVIRSEVEGLEAMLPHLGAELEKAVNTIRGITGKVAVSGMGKSGHVGRKIAATLASTGTPAFFIHPGEASHGDLGMIASGDALLLLSNSGETSELKALIEYSRRSSIPLIAMVRRRTSALVDAADVALILPETPEALMAGAPSTSTTMMMALGDVLAACLMHIHGFSEADFGEFHPGGNLGRKFTKVVDIMRKGGDLPLVHADTLMAEVIPLITAKSLGCAIVVSLKGNLLGIITDGDLRRHLSSYNPLSKAADFMTLNPSSIRPNALVSEAVARMSEKKITSLLVLDGSRPIGLVHLHDALKII